MEVGFLCPPAELNIYFALAMFNKNIRYVAASGLPQWVLRMELRGQRFLRSGAPCWSTQSFQLKYRLLGVTVDPVDALPR